MAVRSVIRPNICRVSLFWRFSFVSAPRSDGGGSARQRAKALGADNRVFMVLVLICDCLCNRSSFKEVRLPMRRCALRAIVRLRGTECIAVSILLPRTALAIARLVRGYWWFSPVGAGSGREKNTLAYLCMENLLVDTFIKVVGHSTHEHALCDVADFWCRDKTIRPGRDRGGFIMKSCVRAVS